MASDALAELLKLSPDERIEIALALWKSLTSAERHREYALSGEQEAELDRRLDQHDDDPGSAIDWGQVRDKLRGGT